MTNEINNATITATTTDTAPKKRTWKEARAAALAGLRARCPSGRQLVFTAAALVAVATLAGSVSYARASARQASAAERIATASAEYLRAASEKLVTPAPQIGYDGQVAAWAKARLDFSKK